MIEAIPMLADRGFRHWWRHAPWERRLIVYASFVLTVSLIVQVVATVLIGSLP